MHSVNRKSPFLWLNGGSVSKHRNQKAVYHLKSIYPQLDTAVIELETHQHLYSLESNATRLVQLKHRLKKQRRETGAAHTISLMFGVYHAKMNGVSRTPVLSYYIGYRPLARKNR